MTLYAAVLLLGQVGADVQSTSPNVISNDQPVQYSDQTESPAAAELGQPAPLRPAVQSAPLRPALQARSEQTEQSASVQPSASVPLRPAVRATASDENSVRQLQPQRTQPPAEIKAGPVAAVAAAPNAQSLHIAATMMEELLVLDEPSSQTLRRVRLVEALSRIGDPSQQSSAIQAYWDLAQAVAVTRFSSDKVRLMSDVGTPASESDQVLLAEAFANAEAEEAAAKDALLAAQFNLLQATGMPSQDTLPWPADAPLVAAYRTRFETIFANQPAPLGLRQIHQSLPGKLNLIEKRVSAMSAAESAADTLIETFKRGGVPLTAVLASIERLDQSRRSFVNSVVDYNHQIAQYSVAVVGAGLGSETLVTTLIKTSNTNSSLVDIPGEVRQAGASTPARDGMQRR